MPYPKVVVMRDPVTTATIPITCPRVVTTAVMTTVAVSKQATVTMTHRAVAMKKAVTVEVALMTTMTVTVVVTVMLKTITKLVVVTVVSNVEKPKGRLTMTTAVSMKVAKETTLPDGTNHCLAPARNFLASNVTINHNVLSVMLAFHMAENLNDLHWVTPITKKKRKKDIKL